MTYEHLLALRQEHAAWRLLRADYAPLAAAFFYQVFIAPKRRGIEVQEQEFEKTPKRSIKRYLYS